MKIYEVGKVSVSWLERKNRENDTECYFANLTDMFARYLTKAADMFSRDESTEKREIPKGMQEIEKLNTNEENKAQLGQTPKN